MSLRLRAVRQRALGDVGRIPDPPGAVRCARSRVGFTLIELLFVTVILGILAMIAVPVYQGVRKEAATATLQEQLRTMAQAQEMHLVVNDVYTDDVEDLDYRPAGTVDVELLVGGDDGWTARLTDVRYGVRCAVYFGDAEPLEPAAVEGEIACDEEG